MKNKNLVFIAKSLDGYIADKDEGLDWLHTIPNPDKNDMGYHKFNDRIDAIVMGRKTFETVCNFDIPWPYSKPVFVVSNNLKEVPESLKALVQIVNGIPAEILDKVHSTGNKTLYIDGGKLVQSFLKEDLIDELILSTIPVLLGGGIPLFGDNPRLLEFEHLKSELFLGEIVQDSYLRKKIE